MRKGVFSLLKSNMFVTTKSKRLVVASVHLYNVQYNCNLLWIFDILGPKNEMYHEC